MELTLSVKDFVNHVHASGDLASQNSAKRMRDIGSKLHQERQATYEHNDQKEVTIKYTHKSEDITLQLNGRMDGLLKRDNTLIIEEIKSTESPLATLDETTYPAHLMQAKIYGYMYLKKHNLKSITLWLTYIHHPSQAIKTIKKRMQLHHLEKTFLDTFNDYIKWLTLYETHLSEKTKSLEGLTFPHEEFREGQYHFMGHIYQNLLEEGILYASAPTGIGKTVGALFSALKTLKDPKEKLFYLTAKNAGKTIAVKTIEDLKKHGLKIKAITLNSKENMCLKDEVDCDPELCEFAKGYYNRVNNALEDIFVHDDVLDVDLIKKYGEYHKVCPHEFALDISLYTDVIICDYNYVFDPRIKLIRYFEETTYQPKLLIDEAHNLVDRARSMYSATLSMDTLFNYQDVLPAHLKKGLNNLLNYLNNLAKIHQLETVDFLSLNTVDPGILDIIYTYSQKLELWLDTHKKHKHRKPVRELYYHLLEFSRISDYFTDSFRFIIKKEGSDTQFIIYCLDASNPLKMIIDTYAKGTALFSATLSPIDYHKALLTEGAGKYIQVPSPFEPSHLGLYLDVSTSTKYREREQSVPRIIDTIYAMLETKIGNYIVFFPSYKYLDMVYEQFDTTQYQTMVQKRGMSLFERKSFIEDFQSSNPQSKILFSVLGGSFSEGIDYIGDQLSGVLVVGVALPQYNKTNEIMKDYFYGKGFNGFDYAYTFPGMNKVIQAVGRVIRTETDKGVAILLDTRYNTLTYKNLLPSHWQPVYLQERDMIQTYLKRFFLKVK